ncbi:hypothetical protein [Helicobacter cinaedi]|uniref:hypothetical protein n=1 Tax=Helicobacter cinaedi TaxID=213 RepID=UPI000CF0E6D1|nr:hypothetical protein [Helicobacter cinaedi]
MKKVYFELTLLDDIVLSKNSNTEGGIEPLDYINGACFLGIVAREYENFSDPFLIFHSGKVRFSDAYPLYQGHKTYKIPLSFFTPKVDTQYKEVYNHHFVDFNDENILNKQLKQLRSGFISKDFGLLHIHYNYTQKSAYDSSKAKSKDSAMFGYNAFEKGSVWGFCVSFEDEIQEQDKIIQIISGTHFIGKSKNAQYGKVLIKPIEKSNVWQNVENLTPLPTTYVYVDSPLALFHQGMPTLLPTQENLKLQQGRIDWEKSQIKTRKFSPFNFKRQCRENARLLIDKGSVIAISNASSDDIATLKNGLGGYLSEGYGEVLINPSFLFKQERFSLSKVTQDNQNDSQSSHIDATQQTKQEQNLLSFIQAKAEAQSSVLTLGEKVSEFISKHKELFQDVSNSQWGEIRMYLQCHKDEYKQKIHDYVRRNNKNAKTREDDVLKKQWEDGWEIFKKELEKENNIEFLKLLAMRMPKERREND